MRPCYIQIKKAEVVPTKRGRRNRTDWHLIRNDAQPGVTMRYEDTSRLFVSLGGSPILTDLDFIQAIVDEHGEGIYNCVAGKKGRRGFWSFLLFVVEDGIATRFFHRNLFDKQRRTQRNNIIAELRELQHHVPLDDAAKLQRQIDDEIDNEQLDQMLNKIIISGKRYGPWPYLKSVMRVGKFANINKKKEEPQNFWGIQEKTEDEIEREEQQKQDDEEEQQRFKDSFKLY